MAGKYRIFLCWGFLGEISYWSTRWYTPMWCWLVLVWYYFICSVYLSVEFFTEGGNLHTQAKVVDFSFATEKSLKWIEMLWCDANFHKYKILQCIFHLNHLVNSDLNELVMNIAAQFIIFPMFTIEWNIWLNYFSSILISH